MKPIGIVRKIDHQGRVVLPEELRQSMQIGDDDPIQFYVEGNNVILKKYEPPCNFCGSECAKKYGDKIVCVKCIEALKNRT